MSKSNKRKRSAAIRAKKKAAATAGKADGEATSPAMDPPYGYRLNEAGEREAAPEEAVVIERMLELAARRVRPVDVAKQLNAEELLARGEPWDAKAVTRVLRRDFSARPGASTSPRDGANRGAIRGR